MVDRKLRGTPGPYYNALPKATAPRLRDDPWLLWPAIGLVLIFIVLGVIIISILVFFLFLVWWGIVAIGQYGLGLW